MGLMLRKLHTRNPRRKTRRAYFIFTNALKRRCLIKQLMLQLIKKHEICWKNTMVDMWRSIRCASNLWESGQNNIRFLHKGSRINQSYEELWRNVDKENEGWNGTLKSHSSIWYDISNNWGNQIFVNNEDRRSARISWSQRTEIGSKRDI